MPSSQSGMLSVECDKGTAMSSVASVVAQQAGYFENTVAGKITKPWLAFFLGYFYNVPLPPNVYIDK